MPAVKPCPLRFCKRDIPATSFVCPDCGKMLIVVAVLWLVTMYASFCGPWTSH